MEQNDIKSRIDIDSLKEKIESFRISYNKKRDILVLNSGNESPAISVDCGGLFWLRVHPETAEIVGIEIEDYQSVYLKKAKRFEALHRARPFPRELSITELSDSLQQEACLAGCR